MNRLIILALLACRGQITTYQFIKKNLKIDPLPQKLPYNYLGKNLKLINAWITLLASPYMQQRIEKIRQKERKYKPLLTDFIEILSVKSVQPAKYLSMLDRMFLIISGTIIPDNYLLFTIPSIDHPYRHVIAYLANQKKQMGIDTLNPVIVCCISEFSSGYSRSKNDKKPNEDTLKFIAAMLSKINTEPRIIDCLYESSSNPRRIDKFIQAFTPFEKPPSNPEYSEKQYLQILNIVESTLTLFDQEVLT